MPEGWYGLICTICFEGLTPEACFVDEHGDRWDFHPGVCAIEAGYPEVAEGPPAPGKEGPNPRLAF